MAKNAAYFCGWLSIKLMSDAVNTSLSVGTCGWFNWWDIVEYHCSLYHMINCVNGQYLREIMQHLSHNLFYYLSTITAGLYQIMPMASSSSCFPAGNIFVPTLTKAATIRWHTSPQGKPLQATATTISLPHCVHNVGGGTVLFMAISILFIHILCLQLTSKGLFACLMVLNK